MQFLSVSKNGSVRLPRAARAHLRGADFVQIRLTGRGITLTPVEISGLATLKAIPEPLEEEAEEPKGSFRAGEAGQMSSQK